MFSLLITSRQCSKGLENKLHWTLQTLALRIP